MAKSPLEDDSILKQLGFFGLITADFLGFSGAGFGLGYYLWKKAGFPWWSMAVIGVGGLVLAVYRVTLYQKEIDSQ